MLKKYEHEIIDKGLEDYRILECMLQKILPTYGIYVRVTSIRNGKAQCPLV